MAILNLRWPGKKQEPEQQERVIRAPRSNPAESVDAMRRRARHRLIGATVLVLGAIVGFPMLFDTQPRPALVNASIEIPDREKVAALAVPPGASTPNTNAPARRPAANDNGLDAGEEIVSGGNAARTAAAAAAAGAVAAGVASQAAKPAEKPAAAATTPAKPEAKPERKPEPKPEAKPEPKPEAKPKEAQKPAKPEPKPEAKPETKPEAKPDPKPEAKPQAKPEPKPKEEAKPKEPTKPKEPAKRDDDSDRVRAMMEGRTAPAAAAPKKPEPAAASRYAIQVGAFAEETKAAEVRAKLQMAGVPAYTQTVKTASGSRVRVRVGPFNSKEDAERAAAKVKAQGLPASLLPM